jgi:hypothetical protein
LGCGLVRGEKLGLKSEVQQLLVLAEQADQANVPDGVDLPDEIKRRECCLSHNPAAALSRSFVT